MITIDQTRCRACGSCIDFCPVTNINMVDDVVIPGDTPCKSPHRDECTVDQASEEAEGRSTSCIECEVCVNICPVKAISMN